MYLASLIAVLALTGAQPKASHHLEEAVACWVENNFECVDAALKKARARLTELSEQMRKDVLEKAMVLHAIDVAAEDPVVMAEADLVILAAPVEQNINMLAELDQHVTTPAVVTDVGSTKRTTVEAARALPSRFTFVGGHPLGGAPRGGIEHARPDLFEKRPWLFTPQRRGRLVHARTAVWIRPRPGRRTAHHDPGGA
jgi:prephenate dehydrogenase